MNTEVVRAWIEYLETWRPQTLPEDPGEFVRAVMGREFTDFHRRWWNFTAAHAQSLILAPRGHGKSTILTVAYTLKRLLERPDTRALIASNTAAQAEGFLREIRAHLENQPLIVRACGPLAGSPWNERELSLASRLLSGKEPSLTALGVLGPVISRHYDLIILDDVVDEEAARSSLGRRRLRTWYFKELLPTLEPDGELHLVGTRYHRDDLYGGLIAAGMPALIEPAIRGEPGAETALWEEKFPLALLRQRREEAGPAIFNSQYQNDVSAMEGRLFRPEWLAAAEAPEGSRLFQGVDLAIGRGDHADYFALVTVGRDGDRWWVMAAYRARLSFEEQFRAVKALFAAWDRPDRPVTAVGVEVNAYQAALAERLRAEGLPVVPVTQVNDKVSRAMRMTGMFESGRLRIGRPRAGESEAMTALVEELLAFPEGEHDDLVDALEIAARLAHDSRRYGELPVRELAWEPGG